MSNTSTAAQVGNPLLYSLPSGRITLEPYWMILAQFVLLQFGQRLWNRVWYKTWFLQLELVVMFGWAYRSTETSVQYNFELDFFDAFQTLWYMSHFVWYCILQGSCMSATNADTWRCFNIFGYVLTNYVTPSAVSLSINIGTKLSWCLKAFKGNQYSQTQKALLGLLGFWCYVPTIAYMSVFLVYINVNILPMFACYEWLVLIWLIGVGLIGVMIGVLLLTCPINRELVEIFKFGRFLLAMLISFESTMGVYLCVLLYNYSQYWYFGDTYIHAIVSEYESRDTNTYFQVLKNSSEQIAHTVLATF
ncbi:unnamed protein product [Rotaria magnacalcarata]|uniref:Uncharacterized protein n=1 Tax=Rotaria magnacalcarata TaxID=392030 RepID=A0A816EBS1_9BILA|nr:unnamed protein product [Rotaria magnacalcarata]CAF1646898.1 unnamed protein product [Rotaria magnacalcarata]CAF1990735.1 unnamed protein product [Rotaria magnacalcarata]CAF2016846.1 unnamed protein product [Rotaria magnacalcarata]CAF2029754.1 unnamed protein product [Rotaria magnacalcarata]